MEGCSVVIGCVQQKTRFNINGINSQQEWDNTAAAAAKLKKEKVRLLLVIPE